MNGIEPVECIPSAPFSLVASFEDFNSFASPYQFSVQLQLEVIPSQVFLTEITNIGTTGQVNDKEWDECKTTIFW